MPERARSDIVEADESGTIRLRLGVTVGAFHVEGPDEQGVIRLLPVMPHKEIAARLEANPDLAARRFVGASSPE